MVIELNVPRKISKLHIKTQKFTSVKSDLREELQIF